MKSIPWVRCASGNVLDQKHLPEPTPVRQWVSKWVSETLPEAQRTQGIDSISWVNLSARIVQDWFQWHYLNWLQIWSPDGATWISSKFGHQMAPLALVQNLVTRSRHLHSFPIWSSDGATCINSKFGHQMAPLELVPNSVTRWHHLH